MDIRAITNNWLEKAEGKIDIVTKKKQIDVVSKIYYIFKQKQNLNHIR